MWSLRNIYLYLVCFVSIILIIFGLISFINSIVDIFIVTDYYPISKYEVLDPTGKDSAVTNPDYAAKLEQERVQQLELQKNNKIKRSIQNLSIFIVALPFYLYHWRKIELGQSQQKVKSNEPDEITA